MAGQRQDRTGAETAVQGSYQHVFSPSMLGAARAMFRDVGARLWSNPLATPISAEQDRGFRRGCTSTRTCPDTMAGTSGRPAATPISLRSARQFGYRIVAFRVIGVRIFDRDTPPSYNFAGRARTGSSRHTCRM